MKIKVTFERIYDSDEFYKGYNIVNLNFEDFVVEIIDDFSEEFNSDELIFDEIFKFEEIKE